MESLKELLLRRYGHFIKAWRRVLDVDNSNRVSWVEFAQACRKLRFKGDAPAAWRCLDDDLSGFITIRELDPKSHNILMSFKDWADKTFGSVAMAFKLLDKDQSGELTFPEFRKACKKYHWRGDPRLLFDCLDNPDEAGQAGQAGQQHFSSHRRSISIAEIGFLDAWEPEDSDEEGAGGEKSPANSPKSKAAKRKLSTVEKSALAFAEGLQRRRSLRPNAPTLTRANAPHYYCTQNKLELQVCRKTMAAFQDVKCGARSGEKPPPAPPLALAAETAAAPRGAKGGSGVFGSPPPLPGAGGGALSASPYADRTLEANRLQPATTTGKSSQGAGASHSSSVGSCPRRVLVPQPPRRRRSWQC